MITQLPESSSQLLTDRMKLRQIVVNLVGNAVKFTEKGTVTVALDVSDDGVPLRVDVVDTGCEILTSEARDVEVK